MPCNTRQPPSSNCTPLNLCPPENFGSDFPTLVGPPGPPGGPGTYVPSYALLRLINPVSFSQGYIAQVGGRTTALDGGDGLFAYDSTSVASDNDGTIIAPVSGVGRWFRIFQGPLSVSWFGAKGNSVTNDSTAIQNTFDAAVSTILFAGYAPSVEFESTVYNIGAASVALLISAPLRIIGNGAQLSYTGNGIALKVAATNVTIRDLILANPVFSFSNPASSLVGTGLQIYNSGFCNLYNVTTSGFAIGRDWYGNGQGTSYSNEYGPAILHCGIGVQFRVNAAGGSYCTHINYSGGTITTGTFSSMVGTRGILISKGGANIPNGINFYGTGCEGAYENKLRTDAQRCLFSALYWDAPNGGTDFVFTSDSADNIIFGGNDLGLQVTADAGLRNLVLDPNKGFKSIIPVNGKIRVYRPDDHTQYLDLDAATGNVVYNAVGQNHVFNTDGVERGRIGTDGKITAASGVVATTGDVVATTGSLKTAAPTSGTSKKWKLGNYVANGVVFDNAHYLEVEVEGFGALRLALAN